MHYPAADAIRGGMTAETEPPYLRIIIPDIIEAIPSGTLVTYKKTIRSQIAVARRTMQQRPQGRRELEVQAESPGGDGRDVVPTPLPERPIVNPDIGAAGPCAGQTKRSARCALILLQSSSFLIFFGGLALGTVLLWRASKRRPTVTSDDGLRLST